MEVIAGVAVAVLGWIVTHIATLRAQNNQFINGITNDARLSLTAAVRDYQNWLASAGSVVTVAKSRVELEQAGLSTDWAGHVSTWAGTVFEPTATLRWNQRLEEYAILFPFTVDVRQQLTARQVEIARRLSKFHSDMFYSTVPGVPEATNKRVQAVAELGDLGDVLLDQTALMQDILVYLQNETLGVITGRKLPHRQPPNPSVPRVVIGAGGKLRIAAGAE